jgi:Domain of unknown function (DUF4411)
MSYLLDANVFIQAKNLYYGLDFCPAFWQWLLHGHTTGRVFSIDKVADEIAAGADELTQWMHAHASGLFLKSGPAVTEQLSRVSHWVTGQQYEVEAIDRFLKVADFYLVAHALTGGHILVTHELAASSARKVKIPNACHGLGLRCMTPYEMLRVERARFVLQGILDK